MTIGFMIALMQGLAGVEQGPASLTAPVRRVHGRWRMQNETVAPIGISRNGRDVSRQGRQVVIKICSGHPSG